MSDESNDGNVRSQKALSQKAGVWTIALFGVAIGLFGGYMINSLYNALVGEQQEAGLDNAGNVDRRADRLVGEPVPPTPIADTTPVADEPVLLDEPVSEVVVPTDVPDQRAQERRTLAYESPLTPPVADIASRIRKREEEQQAATETARANNSDGAPAGVLTNAAFGPEEAVAVGKRSDAVPGTAGKPAVGKRSDAVPGTATKSPARTPADGPHHELYRGSVIAAVLESAIDSDLPGLVRARARVTRDVYDSRTGTHLLIPRGSRLIGVYGQNAAGGPLAAGNPPGGAGGGQRRLFVAWQEMRLPDGTPIALDNFSALGADGASGIKARRATGFLETLGAAVLFDLAGNATAILTAATGFGQQQSETGALANAISGALGNSTQRVGADYVGSLLARFPRFRVKAGSFMNVIVEQDLMLPAANDAPLAGKPGGGTPVNSAITTKDGTR